MTALAHRPSRIITPIVQLAVCDQDVAIIHATHLVHSALCLPLGERMATLAPTEWEAGMALLESDDPQTQQQGIVVLLGVLASVPHDGRGLAQHILDRLRKKSETRVKRSGGTSRSCLW